MKLVFLLAEIALEVIGIDPGGGVLHVSWLLRLHHGHQRQPVFSPQHRQEISADDFLFRSGFKHPDSGIIGVNDASLLVQQHNHFTGIFDHHAVAAFPFAKITLKYLGLAVTSQKCENNIQSAARLVGDLFFNQKQIDRNKRADPDGGDRFDQEQQSMLILNGLLGAQLSANALN